VTQAGPAGERPGQGEALDARTVYAAAGGEGAFRRIVARFYAGVSGDPVLRPLYPEDLAESERHLALFLIQYFGGPPAYSQERGHPRLRMRHLPFPIGQRERDAWLGHMRGAVEAEGLPAPVAEALLDYFDRAATFLMNR
jgi:hemoglobin